MIIEQVLAESIDTYNKFKNIETELGEFKGSFNLSQKREIIKGYDYGLSKDDLNKYAKSKFNTINMKFIRKSLEKGIPDEDIKQILSYGFFDDKIKQIIAGLDNGWNVEHIKKFAIPSFSASQIEQIILGFKYNKEHPESPIDVNLYINSNFDVFEMKFIRMALEKNMSFTDIEPYLKYELYLGYDEFIIVSLENGLSKSQIDEFYKLDFNCNQIEQITLGLKFNLEHPNNPIDIMLYAKKEYDFVQMSRIRLGLELEHGLNIDQIASKVNCAKVTELTTQQIENIEWGLTQGLDKSMSMSQLKMIAYACANISGYCFSPIDVLINDLNNNVSLKQIIETNLEEIYSHRDIKTNGKYNLDNLSKYIEFYKEDIENEKQNFEDFCRNYEWDINQGHIVPDGSYINEMEQNLSRYEMAYGLLQVEEVNTMINICSEAEQFKQDIDTNQNVSNSNNNTKVSIGSDEHNNSQTLNTDDVEWD